MNVGQQIKDARIKAGLSQAEFGEMFGVSGSAVYLWETERGNPSAVTKEKLNELFGVEFDDVKKKVPKAEKPKAEKPNKVDNDLLLQVRVPEQYVHAMMMGGLLGVLDNCIISIMHQTEDIMVVPQAVIEKPAKKPEVTKEPEITEEPEARKEERRSEVRKVRKVIQFRCPECGGMNKRMVFRNNGTYNTVCTHCHAEYSFWDNDMEKSEYNCPDCGELNFYFYPKDLRFDFSKDTCRKCGARNSVYENMQEAEVQQLMSHDYSNADGQNVFKAV